MTKGYWVANIDVHDRDGYKAYVAANAVPFKQFGVAVLPLPGIPKGQGPAHGQGCR
jgi:uncharacterized protein (DUF1330 family)